MIGEKANRRLTAGRMLTATADFHHLRPFGVLAVFTAVLAATFCGTVAHPMGALR